MFTRADRFMVTAAPGGNPTALVNRVVHKAFYVVAYMRH